MNVNAIRQKGYKIYQVKVSVNEENKFPSLTGIDAFRLLNKKEIFGEPYEYLTCRPNLFNPAEREVVDTVYEFNHFFASTLKLDVINKNIQKINLTGHLKSLSVEEFSGEIIDQRSHSTDRRESAALKEFQFDESEQKETKSIRIDLERIEEFGDLVGELIINKIQIESHIHELLKEIKHQSKASINLTTASKHLQLISGKLRDLSLSIRMVPISTLFRKYPRILREIAKKQNKKVKLIIQGEDTELDKAIIEKINDPLLHMIRNSIDHGIENETDRRKRKKDTMARLLIKAYYEGDRIIVAVEDDGRGLNLEKIKKKALEKNLINKDRASQLTDKELMNLIFSPGFSTADNVTDISGRGVGLDVALNNITKLNGTIEVESREGVGTRFLMKLPLTLSIIQALLVREGGETYAIPLFTVHRTMTLDKEKIRTMGRYEVLEQEGEVLPVFDLQKLLEIKRESERQNPFLIELSGSDGKFGLIAEEILGQQEIVIKPLSEYIGIVDGISGATILGNGRVSLILDVKAIGNKARKNIEKMVELKA